MTERNTLTVEALVEEACAFCESESQKNHSDLIGVTDGKAIGTYIEHRFESLLESKYALTVSGSAKGLDLLDEDIATDIKVTSLDRPQSSCPFSNARQKIYGLGYNLLVFVYEKTDDVDRCTLRFTNCIYISKDRTGDYTTTKRIREMLEDGANKEDIIGFLQDRNIPGDETTYSALADEILQNKPEQGYLTISNALQWRLQYSRTIMLGDTVKGIKNHEW